MKPIIAAIKGITGTLGIGIKAFEDALASSPEEVNIKEASKKNTRIRGKLLNRTQRKTLLNNGMTNEEIELFLILKSEFVQQGPSKRLNQSSKKAEKWTLMNRDTGELKEVYIG